VPLQRGDQRPPDGFVVRGLGTELAVVPAELLEEVVQKFRAVRGLHDAHQRPEKTFALLVHGRGEHLPHPGVLDEQARVEVARNPIGMGLDEVEAFLDQARIRHGHPSGHPVRPQAGTCRRVKDDTPVIVRDGSFAPFGQASDLQG
jgi:hypothetical protein